MLDFTPETLTAAVTEQYTVKTEDPRHAKIMASLIKHLHDFVKDVELTEEEWFKAIMFLTETGQKCDDVRQEFILLSDTLGVSMLVDAINHERGGIGTENTVLGPFYVSGAPHLPMGANVIKKDVGGEVTLVRGKVTDENGNPVEGAVLDIWQTAANRLYDVQDPEAPEFNLRGKFTTGADGKYWFVSEKPTSYPIPTDGPVGVMLRAAGRHPMRPAHVHFIIEAPGRQKLTTHIFASGDEYLESDAVFATKSSLIGDFKPCDDVALGKEHNIDGPFSLMDFDFTLMPEAAKQQAA